MTNDDLRRRIIEFDRADREFAFVAVHALAPMRYALIDVARSDHLVSWVRRSGLRPHSIFQGWSATAYGSVSTLLVDLTNRDMALRSLFNDSWGSAACMYIGSQLQTKSIRAQFSKLSRYETSNQKGILRFHNGKTLKKLVRLFGDSFSVEFFSVVDSVIIER